MEPLSTGGFTVRSDRGRYDTARVILAIGRRGVPRKLDVEGENRAKVVYALREPEAYQGDRVLIVGGGDSAVEAAMALAEQPGNHVALSYRRDRFGRIKQANRERIERFIDNGDIDVHWSTQVTAIEDDHVHVNFGAGRVEALPNDQVFVFIGGGTPYPFPTGVRGRDRHQVRGALSRFGGRLGSTSRFAEREG